MWKNYREEQEYIGTVRKDKVTELQELISFWIFKNIIMNPKDIEFKIRPGYDYVSVFDKWEFICYITKEDYHQIVDEDSIVNTHFDTVRSVLNK